MKMKEITILAAGVLVGALFMVIAFQNGDLKIASSWCEPIQVESTPVLPEE